MSRMTTCPDCGSPLSTAARTCPRCDRPSNKLPGGLFAMWAIFAFILLAGVACGARH